MTENKNTHALVARRPREQLQGFIKLEEFPTYDEALTAWGAATERLDDYRDLVAEYAVRSVDDPDIRLSIYDRKPADYYPHREVYWALQKARRKEIGATALWAIKRTSAGASLDSVIRAARESLAKRGITVYPHEVEQAVKSRVLIGRCPDRHAWWIRKNEGPMFGHSCPTCGQRLAATSLALQATFRRLDVEAEKQALRDRIEELDNDSRTDDEVYEALAAGRKLDRLERRR